MAFKITNLDRRILMIAIPSTIGYITTPLIGIVDTAIVGRFDNLAMVAGLALGALAIDVILTSANFLRSGTTGLTAQALGQENNLECTNIFWRATLIAISIGIVVCFASGLITQLSLWALGAKNDVAHATKTYLEIRLYSTPAALINYVVLGFLFGLGRSAWALAIQLLINILSMALSIKWGLWDAGGIQGVAYGTLAAEYVGAFIGVLVIVGFLGYRKPSSFETIFSPIALKQLAAVNRDIMTRSFVLLAAFALFARIGSSMGAKTLATNAVLMHFFLLSGYFLDGLATAAEQLSGYAKGKNDQILFLKGHKRTLIWSIFIAFIISLTLALGYPYLMALLTTNFVLLDLAREYAFWAIITPVTGVLAFHLDGVFIGATWTKDMRKMMIASFVLFAAAAAIFSSTLGNHGLWLALNLFLLTRGILLQAKLSSNLKTTFGSA